ncbi:hypothetical protein [Actinoplanes sp. URMC 104]|uniref:hypothetical protein n=1 Tax=Actinoplanes sp. URMC 104 TaxID=3423409 RepID=UPI003F1D9558
MKFFSNEKDTETQTDPDRTGPVSSEPVGIPPQRAGSPWSDAPRDPADADPDRTVFLPEGTRQGSHPAGDRAPDSPVDLPLTDDDSPDATVRDEGTFDSPRAVDPATGRPLDGDSTVRDDGTFDGPQAVDSATGRPLDGDRPRDAALEDDGTFDSPRAVDPATGQTLEGDRQGAEGLRDSEDFQRAPDAPAGPVAAAAAVPVGATTAPPAAAPAPAATAPSTPAPATTGDSSGERLLPDGDSFVERFREIQLRFVDEPKEATAEAATLVGDAVDRLTSALKAQRDKLGGNADDTEKLRVELRAYREILNRLIAL